MRMLYLSRLDDVSGRFSFDNVLRQLFRGALAADPALSIICTVARGLDHHDFEAEVDAPDRIRLVGAVPPRNERALSYVSTEDLAQHFAQTRSVPYDVIVNGQPGLQPLLWNALANRYSQGRYQVSVPIVSHMMWTITREMMKQTPQFYLGELDLVGESMAAWYGLSIWESEPLRQQWLESVREWLSAASIARLEEMTQTLSNGVDVRATVAVWEAREARRSSGAEVGVFWGGRLTDQKRWTGTLAVLNRLREAGLSVQASTMLTDDDPNVEKWRKSSVPLETAVRRHRMYDLMAQGDVVPCLSRAEGYGSAWLEFLSAGQLVVFKREAWVEHLLPDWYPLIVDREADVFPVCLAAARQWPDGPLWTTVAPQIRAWVRDEHDSQRNGARFGMILEGEANRGIAADAKAARSTIGRLALDAVEDLPTVGLAELGKRMTDRARADREFGRSGDMISPMYLRRVLQAAGWRDVGGSDEVLMERP